MSGFDPLKLFGLPTPIIQAPMAGVSTPAMAAAVSNAGGLGSISIGASNLEQAEAHITQTRELTDKPFNVNVFCHAKLVRDPEREAAWLRHLAPLVAEVGATLPATLNEIYRTVTDDEDPLELLFKTRPAFVSFHFGLPRQEWISVLRSAGIKTLATATNLAEAAAIEHAGVDGIVAQGFEAGGHRGMFDPEAPDAQVTTSVLVRLLVNRTKLPVVAAGGIMDGQGINAALALGAAGVQLGTAFVLCPESAANSAYRTSLKGPRAEATRMTTAISGRPARGLANRLCTHGDAGLPAAPYPLAYDAAKQLSAAAVAREIHEFAAQWAGQGAPLARELSAGELVHTLLAEMAAG